MFFTVLHVDAVIVLFQGDVQWKRKCRFYFSCASIVGMPVYQAASLADDVNVKNSHDTLNNAFHRRLIT